MKRAYLAASLLALSITPALAGGGADAFGITPYVRQLIDKVIALFTS